MKDPLTHGRKTIMGADLSFGRTVTTACGKRRLTRDTSTDPARVDCPGCRAWAAANERELAGMARAAADIVTRHPEMARPGQAPGLFTETAREHDTRAKTWEGQ